MPGGGSVDRAQLGEVLGGGSMDRAQLWGGAWWGERG